MKKNGRLKSDTAMMEKDSKHLKIATKVHPLRSDSSTYSAAFSKQ